MKYKIGERLSWHTTSGIKLTGTVKYVPAQPDHTAICLVDESCVRASTWGDWGWRSFTHPKYALPDVGIYWSMFRGEYEPITRIGYASYKQIFMQKLEENP